MSLPEQSSFDVFSPALLKQIEQRGVNVGESSSSQPQQPDAQTEQRIRDAQALFQAKPSLEIIKRSWTPGAVFEDPICYAKGYRQYSAQWWGMTIFSKSETLAWRLISSSPSEITFALKQQYGIQKFGFEKEMHSLVWMKLDPKDGGRIVHFQDRWDGKDMPGWWAWGFRRLNAVSLPLFMSVPSKVHPDVGAEGKKSKGRQEL